jgi:hypothetical protein
VNCFRGVIPQSLCRGDGLKLLSLDGLRGSFNCPDTARVPFSNVALFNYMQGSIPPCVWDFRNLTALHMSGNGLTGTIASPPSSTLLREVTLAHNQLSGTIPVLIRNVSSLDVSYNKLSGHFYGHNSALSMNVAVNRLSGDLHEASLVSVPYLNVLQNNIFQCNSIPSNDEYYSFYICGSSDFDWAIFLMSSAVALCMTVCALAYVLKLSADRPDYPTVSALRAMAVNGFLYVSYHSRNVSFFQENYTNRQIASFIQEMLDTTKVIVRLCALLLVVSIVLQYQT